MWGVCMKWRTLFLCKQKHMEIVYSILFGVAVVALEIAVDIHLFWNRDKSDKPWSTIMRAVLFVAWALLLDNYIAWYANLLLSYSVFFLLFDWTLNVVRWKEIPQAYFWKLRQGVEPTDFELHWLYPFTNFVHKFFYHAAHKEREDGQSWIAWFASNWYELFWYHVPPQGEVLIKASILLSVLLYFFIY